MTKAPLAALVILTLAAGCGEPQTLDYKPDRDALATLRPETMRHEVELVLLTERRAAVRTERRATSTTVEFTESGRHFTVPYGAIPPVIRRADDGFYEVSTPQGTSFAWASLDDTKHFLDALEVLKRR